MTAYRAAWLCPIDQPPIRNGAVRVHDGRITEVGAGQFHDDHTLIDLGDVVVLPGLINAHTHLELSWMRDRVPSASSFTEWVKTLFAIRGRPDGTMSREQIAAIDHSIVELQGPGTVAGGDKSNSLA
jgi:cytosine/adenosine deaminase-related metal-dependent hydrolase